MKAKLRDLKDKYYGTYIEIDFEDGYNKVLIELWDNDDRKPSERELKQWDEDMSINDIICDNHYESELTYNRAKKIVDALNAL